MSRRARRLAESGVYHVMMRGVNRDAIFLEDEDRERFLHSLAKAKASSGCQVLAYCLMTNHVHLVVRTGEEPIGDVVKRLGVRYAGWFNDKYGRVGHLFQDRFRSEPVEDDAYLTTLLRYVWNNPVEAGLVASPEEYRWSSRHLIGLASALLDGSQFADLLSAAARTQVTAVPATVADPPRRIGRPPRFTDEEVADLIVRLTATTSPLEFRRLDSAMKWLTIRELRTRSVSYEQIARLTGMSATGVRRAHVATPTHGSTAPPETRGG